METLEAVGMSQGDLADRTGRPKKTINEIIKGKAAITPETALQLERVLGIPASFWNNRERQYRETLARSEERKRLKKQVQWLEMIPVKAMIKLGWIQSFQDEVRQLQEVLNFFGIASPAQWESLLDDIPVAFRKSSAFQSDAGATMAWLRKGEIEAQRIDCAPYDANTFKDALYSIRSLTVEAAEVFQPALIRLCARSGVAVVFVPALPQTRVSGAARWLTPSKALIQLSLRYKTDDHLWFTFFHEAGHILLHGKRDVFIERDGAHVKTANGGQEDEANRFAANMLIPPAKFSKFVGSGSYMKANIQRFASNIGIAPGIVVGRLQHDGALPHSHCNNLKRRLEWTNEQD
jgi:addiction module HigA family antidote